MSSLEIATIEEMVGNKKMFIANDVWRVGVEFKYSGRPSVYEEYEMTISAQPVSVFREIRDITAEIDISDYEAGGLYFSAKKITATVDNLAEVIPVQILELARDIIAGAGFVGAMRGDSAVELIVNGKSLPDEGFTSIDWLRAEERSRELKELKARIAECHEANPWLPADAVLVWYENFAEDEDGNYSDNGWAEIESISGFDARRRDAIITREWRLI